ncbi:MULTISPECIES: CynX/NimT family MFS transporter [Streptomycetaceae]|uniref:Putative integral membrane transporter n=1 Tax=Streptantibioticus cattleyicolor (strain ATCC 35852 / DSM 46488 / JCM 4925 / NBRC 14057 / NRRL 8057) TaxID=1003195 RepID=F8JXZ5_STREN|nr:MULTISPECIES: MFS transporter [Streptomycetaceae]AEW93377.1 putative integral membrane transporter [Streptantibioticus cattleyicolor NRRL 8057 = DSM 46488]MYS58091.1 CynX/NimT family MFS transporter [Streptomyces sp. SID5468]CCB73732.1 Transmembrane transport protein [Streptantibioticus cattleyicolor NRRL 8057 = DSM 46488]
MRDDETVLSEDHRGPAVPAAVPATDAADAPHGAVPAASAPPPPGAGAAPGTPLTPLTRRLVAVALVIAAVNLRPAITSLGALMAEVRTGLHMNGTVAGLLTSVPAVCFAVFGTAAPRLARRFGPGAVVCAGMAAIAGGLLLRPFAQGTAVFLAASALGLAGIAVSNVLLPVVVKRYFPDRVGAMTGLYSMALSLGTAVAAASTVPLTRAMGGGWRLGLGVWAALAVVAVVPWLAVARTGRGAAAGAPAAGSAPRVRITRSRTAWALAVFFGLQATGAYITMGWLPQIFRDAGVSAATAGVLLAVTMVLGVPLSFVLPALAARVSHQGWLVAALGAFGLAGYAGLWLAPAAAPVAWALLMGVSNCAFPLALTMIGMRSRTGAGVAQLSAFAQSTGYLLSIPGPILVGALYQSTGGWHLPIALMAALMLPQMAAGILAGRKRHVEDEI